MTLSPATVLGTLSAQHYDGLQNPLQWDNRPVLRDEEIRERVKIPVDERLGGCRGFKSHRPHHLIYFAVERRCFASSILARSMSSASVPAVTALCENHESRISFAMAVDVLLRLSANTFASSHVRAPFAVSASQHRAARTPGTLLAAMVTPVPVQQKTIPLSALPLLTSSPIFSPTSGQPIASPFSGPDRVMV